MRIVRRIIWKNSFGTMLLFDDISFMEVQGVNTNEGIKLIEPIHYEKGYIQLAWRYKTESEKLKEKLKGE